MDKGDKALVTGATGFIGSNLARRLLALGYETHIISRASSNKWRIKDILPKVKEHVVDLRDREGLAKIVEEISPNVIFHSAAAGVVGGSRFEAKELVESNLLATINLIDACDAVDYHCLVNTGSSSEYGPKGKAMSESDVCAPIDAYGVTKCAATMYAGMAAKRSGRPIITIRLFSPYGQFDDKSRLISYAIAGALKNQELRFANPNAVRDYVYVEDIVDLYIESIGKARSFAGEIFNAGTGKQVSISSVVEKIIKLSKSKSPMKWGSIPERYSGAKRWEADTRKTADCLGWKPKHSLEAGLEKTVNWFKENLQYY